MNNFENTESDLKQAKQLQKPKTVNPSNQLMQTPIEQLELQVKSGDTQDQNQINMILSQILSYPSTQFAQIHQQANRLGQKDVQKDPKTAKNTTQDQMNVKAQFCPCCGFVKQEDQIKLCTHLGEINNLGISTFLYFQTIKNLSILLIEMFLIYSIYALATNVIASNNFALCNGLVDCSSNLDYLAISLGSKQQNQTDQNKTFYYIQAWIGVGLVLIMVITFFLLKYYESAQQQEVDDQTTSASDFSIVIQNIPQSFKQQDLQKQLKEYQNTIKGLTNIPNVIKVPFDIRKYNQGKPFFMNQSEINDEQLTDIQKQHGQMIQMFTNWILQRQGSSSFSTTKEQRETQYKKFGQLLKRRNEKVKTILDKIKQKYHGESKAEEVLTTVFITLDRSQAMKTIAYFNPTDMGSKIRNLITCGQIQNHLTLKHGQKQLNIRVQRAPQPEDIIWTNIGVSDWQKLKRKIITYTVTAIMLGLSFAAVYGLSKAQLSNQNNRFLSIFISLVISLINIIISQAIRRLSLFERDYTETKHQTSLAIKSVLAQLINSILVPIIANYYIKSNIYDKNGLADDVFMLGLTNALVAPILKYFDGYYLYVRIMAWHYKKPNNKLTINQAVLNSTNINIQFQVGYQYIYLVNLFLFVCFFVSLQPILPLFAICGYFIMYWTQKYALFNRMRRPVPGTDLVNTAMYQLLFLGPMVYSFGSLTWSNFFPGGIPRQAIVPNLVALGISIFLSIFPINMIFDCFQNKQNLQITSKKYDDNRILFSTQYDRLNPSTAEDGFKDYIAYVEKFNQELSKKGDKDKQQLAKKLQANSKKGQRNSMQQQQMFMPAGFNSLFQPPPPQNNAAMISQQLFPNLVNQNRGPTGPTFQPAQQINQPPPQQIIQPNIQQPQRTAFQPQGFGFQPQGFGFQPQGFGQPQNFGFQPQGFGFQPQGFGFQQQGFGFQPQVQFQGFQQPAPFNPYNNFRR